MNVKQLIEIQYVGFHAPGFSDLFRNPPRAQVTNTRYPVSASEERGGGCGHQLAAVFLGHIGAGKDQRSTCAAALDGVREGPTRWSLCAELLAPCTAHGLR